MAWESVLVCLLGPPRWRDSLEHRKAPFSISFDDFGEMPTRRFNTFFVVFCFLLPVTVFRLYDTLKVVTGKACKPRLTIVARLFLRKGCLSSSCLLMPEGIYDSIMLIVRCNVHLFSNPIRYWSYVMEHKEELD